MSRRSLFLLAIGACISIRVDTAKEFVLSYTLTEGEDASADIAFFISACNVERRVLLYLDFSHHDMIAYRSVGELKVIPTITYCEYDDSPKPNSVNTEQSAFECRDINALMRHNQISEQRVESSISRTTTLSKVNSRDCDSYRQKRPRTEKKVVDYSGDEYSEMNVNAALRRNNDDIATGTSENLLGKNTEDSKLPNADHQHPILLDRKGYSHDTFEADHHPQYFYRRVKVSNAAPAHNAQYHPSPSGSLFDVVPHHVLHPKAEPTKTNEDDKYAARGVEDTSSSQVREYLRHLSIQDENTILSQALHESPSLMMDAHSNNMKVPKRSLQYVQPTDALHRYLAPEGLRQRVTDKKLIEFKYIDVNSPYNVRLRSNKTMLVAGVAGLKGSNNQDLEGLPAILRSSLWTSFKKGEAYVCMQFLWDKVNKSGVLKSREVLNNKVEALRLHRAEPVRNGLHANTALPFLIRALVTFEKGQNCTSVSILLSPATSWITFPSDIFKSIMEHYKVHVSHQEPHGVSISCEAEPLNITVDFTIDSSSSSRQPIHFILTTEMYAQKVNKVCYLRIREGHDSKFIEVGSTVIKHLQPTFCYHQSHSPIVLLNS